MLPHGRNDYELSSAIFSQDVETIERLLDQGADVDDADPVGITSLHLASTSNCANIVQILINHGASVNRSSHEPSKCYTPLHYAVERGHEEIVKILLSNNADVNVHSNTGMSPLDVAIHRKYVNIARVLLCHGASVDSTSSPTYISSHISSHDLWENYQPLHRAVESGRDELVKLLIDNGADVNADAVSGTDIHTGVRARLTAEWTPLHMAAEKGYIGITKILLEHGANVNAGKFGRLTPLCVAMEKASSIDELLRYLKDPENKKRPIEDTKYDIITRLLLEHGAVIVPEHYLLQEELHAAVKIGNTTSVESILKSFPDTIDSFRNARERSGTLLHTAADFCNVKLVEFLVRHGANVNAEDSHRRTPIFYAVDHPKSRGNDLKIVKLLLSNGANVDCRDENMQTPLYHAVKNNHYEMVNFLVMHNACVESHVKSVMSPLHVAVENENAQIAEVLLNTGARINSVRFETYGSSSLNLGGPDSDTGSQYSPDYCPSCSHVRNDHSDRVSPISYCNLIPATPLDCAVTRGHEQLVKLLLSKMISADANSANSSKPLSSAINSGHHRIVKLLLDHGFYINVDDKEIKEAVFKTVTHGYVTTLEHIFNACPDVNVIIDNRGQTLLHYSTLYKESDINNGVTTMKVVQLLIKYGCDLNAVDDDGNTPLLHSLKIIPRYTHEDFNMTKYLLEHGARVDPTNENLQNIIRRLIECAYKCDREYLTRIQILLKYCSDIKVLLHASDSSLFHHALEFFGPRVFRLFIMYGASVNATNKRGQSALHLVTAEGPELMEMLIERGAEIDRRDEDGKTALHKVASPAGGESSRAMTVLLKYGADVNIRSNDNFTALDYALRRYPFENKTRVLMIHHLIKMKAANRFVNGHDLRFIDLYGSYNNLYNSYKTEFDEMRKTKVADTSLCFDNVLIGINYARNPSVVKTLESRDYETKFPLYSDWIKNRFEIAQKRVSLLKRIPTASNSLLGHELPADLSMKVFGYLSNFDLQNIIEVYTGEKFYETNEEITWLTN